MIIISTFLLICLAALTGCDLNTSETSGRSFGGLANGDMRLPEYDISAEEKRIFSLMRKDIVSAVDNEDIYRFNLSLKVVSGEAISSRQLDLMVTDWCYFRSIPRSKIQSLYEDGGYINVETFIMSAMQSQRVWRS